MFNRVTADGYFAGPDGSLDWVVPEEELDKGATEGLADTGTVLFGRRTYEQFEGFWPRVIEEAATAPDPHAQDVGLRRCWRWRDGWTTRPSWSSPEP